MRATWKVLGVLVLASLFCPLDGHGMLWDPINRASRWRLEDTYPHDYHDNQGYCGGMHYQWDKHGGKCGLCGDPYGASIPRDHEIGGLFDTSVIKEYSQGAEIPVIVKLTAGHKGYFYFRLCNFDDDDESEDCFERNKILVNGGETFERVSFKADIFNLTLQLPPNLSCDHCVLQWTYVTANNLGRCVNGLVRSGCGAQETFRTCSDIRINKA